MKKWAAVILAAGMILSLAGCVERGAEVPTPPPSQAVTPMPEVTPEPIPEPTLEPGLRTVILEGENYHAMTGPGGSTLLVKSISSAEYEEMMDLMYPNGIVDEQGLEIGAAENAQEIRANFIAEHMKAYLVQGTEDLVFPVPITPFNLRFPDQDPEGVEILFYKASVNGDDFVFPSEWAQREGGFQHRSEQGLFLVGAYSAIWRIDPADMTVERLTADTYQGKTIDEVREDLKTWPGAQLGWIDRWEISPDGKTLVYRTNRDTDTLNDTSIWKVDLTTGEEKQLIAPTLHNNLVGFLTNDYFVVGSTEDTRMVNVSTGEITALEFPELSNFHIDAVGNGWVVYSSYTDGVPGSKTHVGRVDETTGAVTELVYLTGYLGEPFFSPEQDKIAMGYGTDPERGTDDVLIMTLENEERFLLSEDPGYTGAAGMDIRHFFWIDNDTIGVTLRERSEASDPATTPEPTPEPTAAPTEEERKAAELEFSIVIGDKTLTLGVQDGEFPWGTELEADSKEFWSMDGFHSFEFTCGENLTLCGLCLEAKGTESNGNLTGFDNRNPDYKTYRGAYIGMSLEELCALYPEAYLMTSNPEVIYCYNDGATKALCFVFEDDLLVKYYCNNGIDGFNFRSPIDQ